MHSTVITIDIKPESEIFRDYHGAIFRGWLGSILKCDRKKECKNCQETKDCPYFMVFKEKTDVKPYALLCFLSGGIIRGIIRIHGERRRFVPQILELIHTRGKKAHFGGHNYSLLEIRAREIAIPQTTLGENTAIHFVTPLCLKKQNHMEMMPSFQSLLRASVRTYNRISKYYDPEHYPLRVSEEMLQYQAPIQDYDIRTVKMIHNCMDERQIPLEGVMGSITYDTSSIPEEAGYILKTGEFLQIGKHTTYGFGGFIVQTWIPEEKFEQTMNSDT